MNYLRLSSGRTRDWGLGLAIATTAGIIYLLLRPPLYDNDGYRDRLQALSAGWFWPNPHHLLWNFLQAFFGGLAGRVGHPTTVSFQIAGISFTCLTLLFVFVLLRRAGGSGIFSAAAVVFVAFSPQFWRLGLQNRVYPLLFLAYVLYLLAWQTSDGNPPSGLRLIAAGVVGTIAVLLHQAAILLIAAGVVVLVARNRQSRNSGTLRGLAWGASIALTVLLLYLAAWELIVSGAYGFFQWTTEYAQRIHRPNLFDIGFGMLLVKTIIAICGNVLEPNAVRAFMSAHFSRSSIIAIYALLGAAVCGGVGLAAWRYRLGASTPELLRTDACFAISMLSVLLWGAFMLAWEASPNYYTLLLIPGLLCLATLSKGRKTAFAGRALVAAAIILSVANGYLNHLQDLAASINFPPPLLDAIRHHVGRRGIFIVLEQDGGLGGMDYDLLLTCLQGAPRNPAVAILNDYAWPANGAPIWRDRLRSRIDATLNAREPVFVAGHVLDPDTYANPSGVSDPYTPYLHREYMVARSPNLFQQLHGIFDAYELEPSSFALGVDRYFRLKRAKPPSESEMANRPK